MLSSKLEIVKPSRYLFCAFLTVTIAFATIAAFYAGKAREIPVKPYGYSLLTWKGKSDDDVCFVFVPGNKDDAYMRNWFAKWGGQCGVSSLRKELSDLPSCEVVFWRNRPPKFTYPKRDVFEELFDFAKSRGLDIRMNPMTDTELFPDGP
jgi:hypothetical protein